jgi:tight adherence protein C
MIVLMVILGAGLLAGSVVFLLRASLVPRVHMASHLAQIDAYGVEQVSGEIDEGAPGNMSSKPLARAAATVGRSALKTLPSLPRLDRAELSAAGIYSVAPDVVEGYRLLAGGAAAGLALFYGLVLSGGMSPIVAVLGLAGAGVGWYVPTVVIRRRGRERLAEIDRQLPDLIDLLVASVEAGLGVSAAMSLLSDRFEGPLGEELRLVLHQQRLGTSSAAALTALGERVSTPSTRAFTRTLVRAEAMGGSVGPVLRNLAGDARRRRRQEAKERAAKTPIKLLFPLILLIFPALFVVLLYPAAYTIMQTFGN